MSDTKLDKILEEVQEIKLTLVRHEMLHQRNTETLEEHMRRTALAEERIERLNVQVDDLLDAKDKSKDFVKGIVWLLGIIGSIILAFISGGYFKH